MLIFISSPKIILSLLLFAAFISFPITANGPESIATPHSLADIVEPLLPAVVSISPITLKQGWEDNQVPLDIPILKGYLLEGFLREFFEQMQNNVGSGFIIDAKGHIVTNNHIIENADEVAVILSDNTELKATFVGSDLRTDIAVLKIKSDKKFSFIRWGDSEKLRIGDQVIAIGNPLGLAGTVTTGIVSYINRDVSSRSGDFIGGYIQTDAFINPGGAGGPLCDVKGKVVGVNVDFSSATGDNLGIRFAIPSKIVKKIVKQILQHGRVKRGWIGVNVQPLSEDIGEDLGLRDLKGALVNGVVKNGPAAKSYLRRGDVILKLDNEEIKDRHSLLRIVEDLPIESQVSVTIFRKGKILSIPIQIEEDKRNEEQGDVLPPGTEKGLDRGTEIYGMVLQELTGNTRRQFDISCDTQGVLVADVTPKSSAAEKGIHPGDIIMEINQEEATTLQHALDLFKKTEKENKKSILLLINRNDEPRYISIPIL